MEYLMPRASQMRVRTAQTTRAPISRILEAARFAVRTPHLAPARHVNYHESDAADAAKVAYGPNLDRLRQLKARWDPDHILRRNVNTLPQ
jgi:FAD/FMN-containing dehydrogenase